MSAMVDKVDGHLKGALKDSEQAVLLSGRLMGQVMSVSLSGDVIDIAADEDSKRGRLRV
jgi:hypothetical protein